MIPATGALLRHRNDMLSLVDLVVISAKISTGLPEPPELFGAARNLVAEAAVIEALSQILRAVPWRLRSSRAFGP